MADADNPLTDEQVHERLVAARDALGSEPGATVRGDTAIEAARKALILLQLGLVSAMERSADHVPGVLPPDEN